MRTRPPASATATEPAARRPGASPAAGAPPQSAFTWRTVGVFLPTICLLCYWTSYSEGVVSATSFHSLSPPMHIVVALAFLAAVAVPVHRGIQAGRRWAGALLFLGRIPAIWALGSI